MIHVVAVLLALQLPPGGPMAPEKFELVEVESAIRHLERAFPTSRGTLDAEALLELLGRCLASASGNVAPGRDPQDLGPGLRAGLPFRPSPGVSFIPAGAVEFDVDDFLAVLSFMSPSALRGAEAVRSVLWPDRSPELDAAWVERRRTLGSRLGLSDPGR